MMEKSEAAVILGGTRKYSSGKAKPASEAKSVKKRAPSRDKAAKGERSDERAGKPGLQIRRYFTDPGVDPFSEVEWELRTASITGEGGKVYFEQKDVEFPKSWSQLATNVVVQKYFRGTPGTR